MCQSQVYAPWKTILNRVAYDIFIITLMLYYYTYLQPYCITTFSVGQNIANRF